MLNLGMMNRRVTIEKNTPTIADAGQRVESWSPVKKIWAQVKPKSGAEDFEELRNLASETLEFWAHYCSGKDLTRHQHRLVYQSKVYNIRAIKELGFKQGFIIEGEWLDGI